MTDDAIRLLDIRETPLDLLEVVKSLDHDAAGGMNIFVGNVRDHDHGREVTHLDYTAHPTALVAMRAVAEDVVAEFDVLALAAVHRTGRLAIGESAVVVAVVSAHRAQSYDASRAMIDRLKARVPIWKHQVFSDGSDEWVGTP